MMLGNDVLLKEKRFVEKPWISRHQLAKISMTRC